MAYNIDPANTVKSTLNIYVGSVTALSTVTGTAELNAQPDVMVSCLSDKSGTLYFDYSNDGTNWDTYPVLGFQISSGLHEFHSAFTPLKI